MTQRDLFILHPVAYGQAQTVLEAEADMIRHGQSVEHRMAFVAAELHRLRSLVDVSTAEALGSIVPPNREAFIEDWEEIRARLLRLGFCGTLRGFRAVLRRQGLTLSVLDPLLVRGALGVLQDDPVVLRACEVLLTPRMNSLLNSSAVQTAETMFVSIQHSDALPSVRHRKAVELAQAVLSTIPKDVDRLFEFSTDEVKHLVAIYGRIVDVPFVDIVLHLVQHEGWASVLKAMETSLGATATLHRHVLNALLEARLRELGNVEGEHVQDARSATKGKTNGSSNDSDHEHAVQADRTSLLTVKEAMNLLSVSRQTLHRLVTDGVLVPVRIGRAVRFARSDLERFIGREANSGPVG